MNCNTRSARFIEWNWMRMSLHVTFNFESFLCFKGDKTGRGKELNSRRGHFPRLPFSVRPNVSQQSTRLAPRLKSSCSNVITIPFPTRATKAILIATPTSSSARGTIRRDKRRLTFSTWPILSDEDRQHPPSSFSFLRSSKILRPSSFLLIYIANDSYVFICHFGPVILSLLNLVL